LPILDIIKDPKGVSCFVYPKIEESLENFIKRRGTLNEKEILRIVAMMGLSFSHMHS